MTATMADAHAELARLVEEHQAGLWRYVRYLGADESEADDLVQETFLAVFRNRFDVRSDGQTVVYLRKVARNQLLMLRRKQRSRAATVELDAAEEVWAKLAGNNGQDELLDALEDCLANAVNPQQRRALDLYYHDRASRAEIGQTLDLAVEGVKTLLRRARAALRDCLQRKQSP